MKKITLAVLLLTSLAGFSQTVLINPATDGGFETGTTFEDNGWTVVNPTAVNRKWYLGTGQTGFTGQRCAFIGNSETEVGTATAARKVHLYRSISIPAGAENIILTFNYKQETADVVGEEFYDYIAVYTSTATPINNKLSTGDLQFGPYPDAGTTGFQSQTVTLPNSLAGTTTNLIFTFVADNITPTGYGAVDDVSLTYIVPACAAPSNLAVANITGNSATLSWNASVSNPALGYDYYITETATAPDTNVAPTGSVTGTAATVSTLSGSTTYYLWVKSKCSATEASSFSGPVAFSTLCPAQTVPYAMGFEDGEGFECVKIENLNAGTTWTRYANGGNGAATGTNSARYKKAANKPGDDWFYLNGITLTAGQAYDLKFKYKATAGPDLVENLEVKFGNYPKATAMTSAALVTLEGINTAAADAFLESTATFTPATTGVYYIGFHNYSIAAQGTLYVDDITVDVSLSTPDFEKNTLSVYPNPVKDFVNIAAQTNVQSVSVYTLLGQEVLTKKINATSGIVNMANLPAGNYMVKVVTGNATKTYKIVKQ